MIKGKELIGRSIVALSTGEKVESVHDVVFDHQANQVLALLVEEGGLFRSAKAVPFERVRSIGEHAVMIGRPEDVTTSRDDSRLAEALESKTTLIGMTLLTADGQNLGRIADVYFDEGSGAVVGYEATGGLFADLSSGRAFVPAPSDVQIGSDNAIVPLSVATAMRENPGGLRGAFKSVGDAVSGTVQSAGESVRDGVQSAGESVRGAAEQAGESVRGAYQDAASAAHERQKAYVVGKVAGADVVLDNGMAVAHQGDVISAAQAEAAEKAGKLTALASAVTGAALTETVQEARTQLRDTYEDVKDAAADRQRDFVVGKVAGRNVVADSGEVVIARGVTIAPHHAARAEQTGQLAALTAAAAQGAVAPGATSSALPLTAHDTLGRRVRTDVRAPGGSLLAVQGQIVTTDLLARAENLGLEQALIDATVEHSPAPSANAGAASAAVASGVANVTEGASQLLSRAKHWLHEKRDETEAALQSREETDREQRVRDALGRPVNRVILAPDDSIILNVGEIITNRAIEAARQGRVLDILLESVSHDAPKIDPLATRPDETGQAALESQPLLTHEDHKPS